MQLDKQYINLISSSLEGFAWTSDTMAHCRCPICGDSQTNRRKKRGYFIPSKTKDSYTYGCHNCGVAMSIRKFLADYHPEDYSQYKYAKFKDYKGETEDCKIGVSNTIKPVKQVQRKSNSLIPISKLSSTHHAYNYLSSRGVPQEYFSTLYYTKDYGEVVYNLTSTELKVHDERIVIPFYNADKKLIAIQGRALAPKSSLRYITTKLCQDAVKIWGMDLISDGDVFVMEGTFKAMHIKNCIAMGGSDVSIDNLKSLIDLDRCIFCYDNEPRNIEIVQRMEKIIDSGLRIVIWVDCPWAEKDVDDIVVKCGADKYDVEQYLIKNTYQGLTAKMKFMTWKKV